MDAGLFEDYFSRVVGSFSLLDVWEPLFTIASGDVGRCSRSRTQPLHTPLAGVTRSRTRRRHTPSVRARTAPCDLFP